MFLSNRHAAGIAVSLAILVGSGCGWLRIPEPPAQTSAPVEPPDTSIPFETKEPETYQADFVNSVGNTETTNHFSRKLGKWRFDSFAGTDLSRSIIRGDSMIYVDHRRKIYSEPVSKASDPQPPFLNDLTDTLLNGKHPAKFEKVTVENTDGLDVYKVTIDGSNSTSIITYDPSIKMVVRHEFDGGFAFAMRNFNLEVEDSTFRIPAAYRKVAWSAFEQQ